MTLKAILFDAGDILYHRPRRGKILAAFLKERGLVPIPPAQPARADLKRRAHAGEISKDEHHDAVLELCGVTDAAERAKGRGAIDDDQSDVEFFDGVPETLHRLKAAGLRLGVVTNTFDSTAAKLGWFARVGIDKLWDSFANSCEVKVNKPDARIYLAALEPLNLAPGEAAFVGHAAAELAGAKALGMTTIAFNRDDKTVEADHIISRFSELPEVLERAGS
jgi:FMN phosphatase YigB (HAD superfamily)